MATTRAGVAFDSWRRLIATGTLTALAIEAVAPLAYLAGLGFTRASALVT